MSIFKVLNTLLIASILLLFNGFVVNNTYLFSSGFILLIVVIQFYITFLILGLAEFVVTGLYKIKKKLFKK